MIQSTLLPTEIVHNGEPAIGSLIFLHGLGADKQDFIPLADHFLDLKEAGVRFVFPQAPNRPISLNQGMVMSGWYDIYGLGLDDQEDTVGIQNAAKSIKALIDAEYKQGVPYHKIVLGGFSQGGALALYSALTHQNRLGAVVGCSTYLPSTKEVVSYQRLNTKLNLPIFLAHGLFDPLVTYQVGKTAKEVLEKKLQLPVTWHSYPMEHTMVPEEIEAIYQFLKRVFLEQ